MYRMNSNKNITRMNTQSSVLSNPGMIDVS